MKFDYSTLRSYETTGEAIGKWNGKTIYAASKDSLDRYGNGAYYIVYDDDNRLVSKVGDVWYAHALISGNGSVSEFNRPLMYVTQPPQEEKVEEDKKAEPQVVGDVKTEIDVEETLKKARELTVTELLDGFNYGF